MAGPPPPDAVTLYWRTLARNPLIDPRAIAPPAFPFEGRVYRDQILGVRDYYSPAAAFPTQSPALLVPTSTDELEQQRSASAAAHRRPGGGQSRSQAMDVISLEETKSKSSSSMSAKEREREAAAAAKRAKARRKPMQRCVSPSHFLVDESDEVKFGSPHTLNLPGREGVDRLFRAVASMYYRPKEVHPSGTQVWVSREYDNVHYPSIDLVLSPLRKKNVLDTWTPLEIALFESGMCRVGKDFNAIQKIVKTKTTGELVEFYYTKWKRTAHYQMWKNKRDANGQLLSLVSNPSPDPSVSPFDSSTSIATAYYNEQASKRYRKGR